MTTDTEETFYVVYWLDEKTVSVVREKAIVQKKVGKGNVLAPVKQGDTVAVKWSGGKFAARVVSISVSPQFLKSLNVHKETGNIIPHQNSVEPPADIIALRKQLKTKKKKADKSLQSVSISLPDQSQSTPVDAVDDEKSETTSTNVKCNGGCSMPVLLPDLLPKLKPEFMETFNTLLEYVYAVQHLKGPIHVNVENSSEVSIVKGLAAWQLGGYGKMEIGRKGSGVWLSAEDVSVSRPISRGYKKNADKSYFRRLLYNAFGEEEINRMAAQHEGASKIPSRLFSAIEEMVNQEFHSKTSTPPGRSYYFRSVNNVFCKVRALDYRNTDECEQQKPMGGSCVASAEIIKDSSKHKATRKRKLQQSHSLLEVCHHSSSEKSINSSNDKSVDNSIYSKKKEKRTKKDSKYDSDERGDGLAVHADQHCIFPKNGKEGSMDSSDEQKTGRLVIESQACKDTNTDESELLEISNNSYESGQDPDGSTSTATSISMEEFPTVPDIKAVTQDSSSDQTLPVCQEEHQPPIPRQHPTERVSDMSLSTTPGSKSIAPNIGYQQQSQQSILQGQYSNNVNDMSQCRTPGSNIYEPSPSPMSYQQQPPIVQARPINYQTAQAQHMYEMMNNMPEPARSTFLNWVLNQSTNNQPQMHQFPPNNPPQSGNYFTNEFGSSFNAAQGQGNTSA